MSRSRAPDTPSPVYPSRDAPLQLHLSVPLQYRKGGGGINKGGAFARSAPLFRLLLVLFLPKQEKNEQNIAKTSRREIPGRLISYIGMGVGRSTAVSRSTWVFLSLLTWIFSMISSTCRASLPEALKSFRPVRMQSAMSQTPRPREFTV